MKIKLEHGHTYKARNGKVFPITEKDCVCGNPDCFHFENGHRTWKENGSYLAFEESEYDLIEEVIETSSREKVLLDKIEGLVYRCLCRKQEISQQKIHIDSLNKELKELKERLEKPSLTPNLDKVDGYIGKLREENIDLKNECANLKNNLRDHIKLIGDWNRLTVDIASYKRSIHDLKEENEKLKNGTYYVGLNDRESYTNIILKQQDENAMLKRHNAELEELLKKETEKKIIKDTFIDFQFCMSHKRCPHCEKDISRVSIQKPRGIDRFKIGDEVVVYTDNDNRINWEYNGVITDMYTKTMEIVLENGDKDEFHYKQCRKPRVKK